MWVWGTQLREGRERDFTVILHSEHIRENGRPL